MINKSLYKSLLKHSSFAVATLFFQFLLLPVSASENDVTVRVGSYNVEFSKSATPEQIGEMLKPYKLDIIGFNEAPDGDWTSRVGKVLEMKYCFVGKISSANHKDKYKTILSRTPLNNQTEPVLEGEGWNPASAVRATTEIKGIEIAYYALHVSESNKDSGSHSGYLATQVLSKEKTQRMIIMGDFNNCIGDSPINFLEKSGMRPTWKDLKIDLSKEFTWNALDEKLNEGVIDHIMYNTSSGAKATNGGIIELKTPLSDHKPIWAEIVFPKTLP